MSAYAAANQPDSGVIRHVLDDPPPFHAKLLEYGERPYWSPDGTRIVFVERNYGDIAELDFGTRRVRRLTHALGDHHTFLRVLFMHNGEYLLIGPPDPPDPPATIPRMRRCMSASVRWHAQAPASAYASPKTPP